MKILMAEAFAKINPIDPFNIAVFVIAPVFICYYKLLFFFLFFPPHFRS
jgi:hypothetical protein